MDYENGQIYYQELCDYEEIDDEDDLKAFPLVADIRFGQVAPLLLKVVNGSLSPEKAIEKLIKE